MNNFGFKKGQMWNSQWHGGEEAYNFIVLRDEVKMINRYGNGERRGWNTHEGLKLTHNYELPTTVVYYWGDGREAQKGFIYPHFSITDKGIKLEEDKGWHLADGNIKEIIIRPEHDKVEVREQDEHRDYFAFFPMIDGEQDDKMFEGSGITNYQMVGG